MSTENRLTFERSWPSFLPHIDDVMDQLDAASGEAEARVWLDEREISTLPVTAKLLRVVADYDFNIYPGLNTGRLVFTITGGAPNTLALPVVDGGRIIDMLLIDADDEFAWATTCGTARWLGRDALSHPVVRLHPHPIDWIEAGCTGACHIDDNRRSFSDLAGATTIQCNDIETALAAWDHGFGAEDEALDRFTVDDDPANIRAYFERQAARIARTRKAA